MANASYFQEQARLLLRWASEASDPAIARRLMARAQDHLARSQSSGLNVVDQNDVFELFNASQLLPSRQERPKP